MVNLYSPRHFLVVGVALVPASVGGRTEIDTGRIISIQQTGNAVAATNDNTTYVWQSERYTVNVTFRVYTSEDKYSVCLYDNRTDSDPEELDCQSRRKRVENDRLAQRL